MTKNKIIKIEFLFILFLLVFYNLDKIENADSELVRTLVRFLKDLIELILI